MPADKTDWEAAHRAWKDWGNPSPRRFAILRRMLELDRGDIVVMPKMPALNQFTIACASGRYRFELADGGGRFGTHSSRGSKQCADLCLRRVQRGAPCVGIVLEGEPSGPGVVLRE